VVVCYQLEEENKFTTECKKKRNMQW